VKLAFHNTLDQPQQADLPTEGAFPDQELVNLRRAWQITDGGGHPDPARCASPRVDQRGPCVAIVDTTLDVSHPDLADHYAKYYQTNDPTSFWDLFFNQVEDPQAWSDLLLKHGTHVASVAVARANNQGPEGMAGVLWDTRPFLYELGLMFRPAVIWSVRQALRDGVRVLNYSHGQDCSQPECSALEEADDLWRDLIGRSRSSGLEVLFVFAAGNYGGAIEEVSPARLASDPEVGGDVLAVGGVQASGRALDDQSQYSPGSMLVAPWTARVAVRGGSWSTAGGTSFSAPFVTGAAGLMLTQNAALTAAALKDRILQSANRVGADPRTGTNLLLLDACRAVKAASGQADPPSPTLVSPGENGVIPFSTTPLGGIVYDIPFQWSDASEGSCNGISGYRFELRLDGALNRPVFVHAPATCAFRPS
jgi:Subtilase family